MLKFFVAFIICISFMYVSMYSQKQEVEASFNTFPVMTLTDKQARVLISIIQVAGVSANKDMLLSLAEKMYLDMPQSTKNNLNNSITTMKNDLLIMSSDVWNYSKKYIKKNVSVGKVQYIYSDMSNDNWERLARIKVDTYLGFYTKTSKTELGMMQTVFAFGEGIFQPNIIYTDDTYYKASDKISKTWIEYVGANNFTIHYLTNIASWETKTLTLENYIKDAFLALGGNVGRIDNKAQINLRQFPDIKDALIISTKDGFQWWFDKVFKFTENSNQEEPFYTRCDETARVNLNWISPTLQVSSIDVTQYLPSKIVFIFKQEGEITGSSKVKDLNQLMPKTMIIPKTIDENTTTDKVESFSKNNKLNIIVFISIILSSIFGFIFLYRRKVK